MKKWESSKNFALRAKLLRSAGAPLRRATVFFLTRPTIGDKPRKTWKTWTFFQKPIWGRSDLGHVHISEMVRARNYLFILACTLVQYDIALGGWALWWMRKGSKIYENRNKNDNVVPPVILKIHTSQTRFFKNTHGRVGASALVDSKIHPFPPRPARPNCAPCMRERSEYIAKYSG